MTTDKFKQHLEREIEESRNVVLKSRDKKEQLRAGLVMAISLYYHLLVDSIGFDQAAFQVFIDSNEDVIVLSKLLKETKI
jgi:hypothetical protein